MFSPVVMSCDNETSPQHWTTGPVTKSATTQPPRYHRYDIDNELVIITRMKMIRIGHE